MSRSSNLLLANLLVCLLTHGYGGIEELISEEDVQLERQLGMINKPAVKAIQTEYGDVIDCVDIYKQLAFDHPLLKNHKIQRKASFPLHYGKIDGPSRAKPVEFSKGEGCPSGSIPVRRTSKADLIRRKLLKTANFSPQANGLRGHFSTIRLRNVKSDIFNGGGAQIAVYRHELEDGQISAAQIWIEGGPSDNISSLQVGWMVNPTLYGDNQTHLFIYWTADGSQKTGCYDLHCGGFVQVDKRVPLGGTLSPTSVFNGDQYVMTVFIYRDNVTGNWWLVYANNVHVGYWPKEVLPNLDGGASSVVYGGRVQAQRNQPFPPMGNGYYAYNFDFDFREACYFKNVQYLNEFRQIFFPVSPETYNDSPVDYGLHNIGRLKGVGYTFLFGGLRAGPLP